MHTFEAENTHTVKLRIEVKPATFMEKEISFPLFETSEELASKWNAFSKIEGATVNDQRNIIREFLKSKWNDLPVEDLTGHYCETFFHYVLKKASEAKKAMLAAYTLG